MDPFYVTSHLPLSTKPSSFYMFMVNTHYSMFYILILLYIILNYITHSLLILYILDSPYNDPPLTPHIMIYISICLHLLNILSSPSSFLYIPPYYKTHLCDLGNLLFILFSLLPAIFLIIQLIT